MFRANPKPGPVLSRFGPRTARILAVLAAGLAFALAWSWWSRREERALLAMPPAQRQSLYRRQLADLSTLCAAPDWEQAFSPRCRELALFLTHFPECDDRCRTLIDPWLPKPSR